MTLLKIRENLYIDWDKVESINTGTRTVTTITGHSYSYDNTFEEILKSKNIVKKETELPDPLGCGI